MKSAVYDLTGKEKEKIDLPKCFSGSIREDIVFKCLEAAKTKQPYGPAKDAGQKASASGKLKHHRGVWKSQYKRGMSRIPRKIMLRRGSQFQFVGATSPNTVGGRRTHPPKPMSMINTLRINKKELKLAMISALSATATPKVIALKYSSLEDKDVKAPIVLESKVDKIKTKKLLEAIKKIVGDKMFNVAVKKRSIRAGIGTLRGRKYKSTAGMLLVVGKDEKVKTSSFEVKPVSELSVTDLANGGLGRITVYTEKAIKEIGEKYK